MLKSRAITGAFICVAICILLLFSGNAWFLNTVIACLCVQTVFELYRATGAKNNRIFFVLRCIAAAVLSYISIPYCEAVIAVRSAFYISVLLYCGTDFLLRCIS